jgi:hypothetical protein
VKFEFLVEHSNLEFVVRVNALLGQGWTRNGSVLVGNDSFGSIVYCQAFEKTGVGNE